VFKLAHTALSKRDTLWGMDKAYIAKWIRARRELAGKSRSELAHEIGVEARAIYRWENGQNLEYLATTVRLLTALGVRLPDDDGAGELPASVSAELQRLRQELREALTASTREIEAAVAKLQARPKSR